MQAVQTSRRRLLIAASVNNVNLYTLFNSPRRPGRYIATILPGVTVGSTTTASAALSTGAFPAQCRLEIENYGTVLGKEGAGGIGGYGVNNAGAPGEAGGDAIAVNCNLTILNHGNIRAGGGGGGGGEGGDDGQGGG